MTGLLHPARVRAISEIEDEVRGWPGMQTGIHRFGGIDFRFHGKEAGHIHGNGLLDCLVGRANRESLVRDERALPHHIFPRSGWISFWIRHADDVQPALDLIRVAVLQIQPTASPLAAQAAGLCFETQASEAK